MLCGQTLVTDWSRNDWWMSVITSSGSASLEMAVFLNLRDVLLCVKVLIAIATGSGVSRLQVKLTDFSVPKLNLHDSGWSSVSSVREVSEKNEYSLLRALKAVSENDMDSLLRHIEQYSQRYFITTKSSQRSILEEKGLGCLEVDSHCLGGSASHQIGVWDGKPSNSHGGAICENEKFAYGSVCERHLFDNLLRHRKFLDDIKLAIAETFQQTDQDYLWSEINHMDAASTACTCLVVGDRLLVANIGDSRAVVCRGGEAVALSIDQTPNRTHERKCIEDAGGVVEGLSRVSRAFGARSLKRYVVADPEIQEYDIEEGVDFLVLATAGLWNMLSNQEAVSMIEFLVDPVKAAMVLAEEAYRRGSADNITCVIICFSHIH
ncbi:unnamed protein product [Sphagnum troendelagicum]|uniref:PPM-type phosphatase domain-containing protein n=1 Tax=Sphagnum troendelagicum TaxID=128251 RepID=A0ABP0UB57_9BRYO